MVWSYDSGEDGERSFESHHDGSRFTRCGNTDPRVLQTGHALSADYTEDPIFENLPAMRLITRILALNEAFSNNFAIRGHMRQFENRGARDDEDLRLMAAQTEVEFHIPLQGFEELANIIKTEPYDCPDPSEDSIMAHIEAVYNSSRGPELGTVRDPSPTFPSYTLSPPGGFPHPFLLFFILVAIPALN